MSVELSPEREQERQRWRDRIADYIANRVVRIAESEFTEPDHEEEVS